MSVVKDTINLSYSCWFSNIVIMYKLKSLLVEYMTEGHGWNCWCADQKCDHMLVYYFKILYI